MYNAAHGYHFYTIFYLALIFFYIYYIKYKFKIYQINNLVTVKGNLKYPLSKITF